MDARLERGSHRTLAGFFMWNAYTAEAGMSSFTDDMFCRSKIWEAA
jgi:hypothetical protein